MKNVYLVLGGALMITAAAGKAQPAVLMAIYDELKPRGINAVHSATDEIDIDLTITSYNALSSDVKDIVWRIGTPVRYSFDYGGKIPLLRYTTSGIDTLFFMSLIAH